jgi:valyl-tRNA synthetase
VALKAITINMDSYNFVVANRYLINFVWEDFCNHYLEFAKPLLNDPKYNNETNVIINTIFKNILILLHPHAPFASDCIYREMFADKESIMQES